MKARQKNRYPAQEAFEAGRGLVKQSPVLGPLLERAATHFDDSYPMAKEDWAWVASNGNIYANRQPPAQQRTGGGAALPLAEGA